MTSPINKFEAIGIFGSIGIMVVALLLLRSEFGLQSNVATVTEVKEAGVVVVDTETQNEDAALADGLLDAGGGAFGLLGLAGGHLALHLLELGLGGGVGCLLANLGQLGVQAVTLHLGADVGLGL